MRNVLICVLAFFVFMAEGYGQVLKITPRSARAVKKIIVFGDENGVFVPSGWMGDTNAIAVSSQCPTNPRGGTYCQKWTYTIKKKLERQGWAGVYWQYPANNWGSKRGYDLTGYKRLTFWVRGDKGGEVISITIGGIKGDFPDSMTKELGKIKLSSEWRRYTIDLSGKNLSSIIGGFSWAVDSKDNPEGCVFYFDDIIYE